MQHLQKHLKKQKMGLLNKDENWWLRLTIVIITLISLSTLSYYNRQVTQLTTKSTSDSTAFYKFKCDSLSNENKNLTNISDSIRTELFIEQTNVGRYEMGLEFLKERRPNEYNLLMHYISTQTE